MSMDYDYPHTTVTIKGLRLLYALQEGSKSLQEVKDISGYSANLSNVRHEFLDNLLGAGLVKQVGDRTYKSTGKGAWYLDQMIEHRNLDVEDLSQDLEVQKVEKNTKQYLQEITQ
jgi:predicted transcriptional regulator